MQSEMFSPLPPFVPDEMLFLVEEGTREGEIFATLEEVVGHFGGTLVEGGRGLGDAPIVIEGAESVEVVPVEGLNANTARDAYEIFEQIDRELAGRGSPAVWNPNWMAGATPESPGNGPGGGPGARPVPLGRNSRTATRGMPLRRELLDPLRAATRPDAPVRVIILDSWNGDKAETEAWLGQHVWLRFLNDHCLGVPFRMRDFYASQDDPFPMPDHGLFVAAMANEVIGAERLCLHDSLRARMPAAAAQRLGDPTPGACITLEAVRVLDDFGTGDMRRLLDALSQVAASIQPGERVVVNLSLMVNIPDFSWARLPFRLMFDGRWPWQQEGAGNPRRLDRALYQAIRALHDKGALVVAAAGNNSRGEVARRDARYPAAYKEVLGVTAADVRGKREAWYANRVGAQGLALFAGDLRANTEGEMRLDSRYPLVGPFTDSAVPTLGREADPQNQSGLVAWAGTSFATPLAVGLAALLWSGNPDHSAAEVRTMLASLAGGRRLASGTPFVPLFDFENGQSAKSAKTATKRAQRS